MGRSVKYRDVWQKMNLLLVTVPKLEGDIAVHRYLTILRSCAGELMANDTAVLVRSPELPGRKPVDQLSPPSVAVADRYGELVHVERASKVDELPRPRALLEWLRYVQTQCPECQGETK